MKVKVKLTNYDFSYLTYYVKGCTYDNLSELQILNIRLFLPFALKKMIDYVPTYTTEKIKTFNIEVNQYMAIMALLTEQRNYLDPYTLALFITLQNQNKQLLHLN